MDQKEFELLVVELCKLPSLAEGLAWLKASEDTDIAEAANALTGQFALAEVEGERRIYHVFNEENEAGELTEYVEHVMNEGDHLVKFAAWFFSTYFDMKPKEVYQAAGKTYQQPKRG
ncbi:hypothetical protein HGP28_04270 [Vibrio sp. SM6]|uniref:Uncharacterized protein n=1 Tax=Vibrio agarilyticus TaxID=2726741 RepID=A0A7X8TNQ7_9VIBR|nr:hypothetical protein [Vibrio agarilyticus]NLS12108.1 hypothetical protein [Vibrio agarilyticus]